MLIPLIKEIKISNSSRLKLISLPQIAAVFSELKINDEKRVREISQVIAEEIATEFLRVQKEIEKLTTHLEHGLKFEDCEKWEAHFGQNNESYLRWGKSKSEMRLAPQPEPIETFAKITSDQKLSLYIEFDKSYWDSKLEGLCHCAFNNNDWVKMIKDKVEEILVGHHNYAIEVDTPFADFYIVNIDPINTKTSDDLPY